MKTSEERIVALCPRAVAVLKRQLALRERWQRLGTRIDHEHVFVKEDGEPIRHLHYGWKRWRRSLERLGLRPRAPYKARHSFITWNLMIGNNPLWVAKQHGHSAHFDAGRLCELDGRHGCRRHRPDRTSDAALTCNLAPTWPQRAAPFASTDKHREMCGGERGIRTLDGLLTHTPLAGVRLRPLGHLSGARSTCQGSARVVAIYHLSGSSAHEAGGGPLRRPARILAATR
jgi:hypothetical protein